MGPRVDGPEVGCLMARQEGRHGGAPPLRQLDTRARVGLRADFRRYSLARPESLH